jgi:hypothetical protein
MVNTMKVQTMPSYLSFFVCCFGVALWGLSCIVSKVQKPLQKYTIFIEYAIPLSMKGRGSLKRM